LPPQLPEHKGKLTVVMELDEVLAYTFTPDEEGYMFAPLRLHDYYASLEEYNAYLSIYKRKNL
jgi:CTD small phosphatase-like protein 2